MEVFRNRSSFLLTQFREFYREAVRLKRSVQYSAPVSVVEGEVAFAAMAGGQSGTSSVALLERPRVAKAEGSAAVLVVWQPLLSMLERQAAQAGEAGGSFAFEVYREAQYVMAALADELFLHLEWEGRDNWPLLEARLFRSHIAGEEVFDRMDRLLQRNDSFYLDLASVYFLALSLGFQGKYRGAPTNRLALYRQQLFNMIYRRNPRLFSSGAQLFPQAYQNVLGDMPAKKLPPHWAWLWLPAGVLVVWAVVAQFAWSSATSKVSCLICNALQRGCVCEAGPAQTAPRPPASSTQQPAPGVSK